MKQNKKLKFTLSFASPEKKLLFYIYAVIVKQIFYKRSTNHYSGMQPWRLGEDPAVLTEYMKNLGLTEVTASSCEVALATDRGTN